MKPYSSNQGRLRILHAGMSWTKGQAGHGSDRYLVELVRELSAQGENTRAFVAGEHEAYDKTNGQIETIAHLNQSLLTRRRLFATAIREASRDEGPVVVASHFAAHAAPLRDLGNRLTHVTHFHGPWADEARVEGAPRWKTTLQWMLEQRVYRTANRFITLSENFADLLAERYGVDRDRVRVVPGGVNVAAFSTTLSRRMARKELGWDKNRPTVLCVRRLSRRMGIEQLLQAFEQVLRSHPDVVLMIAGKGPQMKLLQETIDRLRIQDSVKLLGFVPEELLPATYRAADFTVVPSQSLEGFGLIIAESLASGTPAMVTPVGGMPEVVRKLDPSLIFEDSSIDAISEGISRALGDTNYLPNESDCLAYAKKRFDWPIIARQVLAVYHEAVEAHG